MKKIDFESLPNKISLANEWLTPKQLEEELGISKTLQEKMRMKKVQMQEINPIPFSKFGKSIFYNRKKIHEWLLSREV